MKSIRDINPYPLAVFSGLFLLGFAAFIAGVLGWQTQRIWQAYLVNFLFFSGLAYGGVMFVALMNVTNAKFGRPMKRLAESLGAFLPFSLLLFVLLYFGREAIFPWIHEPVPHKEPWLNVPFLFLREGLGFLLLTGLAMVLLSVSIKSDLLFGGRDTEPIRHSVVENHRFWRIQIVVSHIFTILYVFIITMTAWDLIMSLSPHWYSTLFGAYVFVSWFYSAIAALFIISILMHGNAALKPYIEPKNFHDLGKFLLAFLLVTGDFYFSQHLLIWYGNLPEETRFLIDRFHYQPWETLSWIIFAMVFVFPFFVLLIRRVKMNLTAMFILCLIILVGMWLEKLLLIAPSIWPPDTLPLGWVELLITCGFFGIMGLCVLVFLNRFPVVPMGDPIFLKTRMAAREEA